MFQIILITFYVGMIGNWEKITVNLMYCGVGLYKLYNSFSIE